MSTIFYDVKISTPSGNWFTGFKVDSGALSVTYTAHDRRRGGQVCRRYTVTFKNDLRTIEKAVVLSARGGRMELFRNVSIRRNLSRMLTVTIYGGCLFLDNAYFQ